MNFIGDPITNIILSEKSFEDLYINNQEATYETNFTPPEVVKITETTDAIIFLIVPNGIISARS